MWVQDVIKAALSEHAQTVTFQAIETGGAAFIDNQLHEDCDRYDWWNAQRGLWLLSLEATAQQFPVDLLVGDFNEFGERWLLRLGDEAHDNAAETLAESGVLRLSDFLWNVLNPSHD